MPDPLMLMAAAGLSLITAAVIAWLIDKLGLPGGALGVGTGLLAGTAVLGLTPRLPPQEALDRTFVLLLPAGMLAETLAASAGRTRWFGQTLRALIALLAPPVLVHGSSYVTDLAGPGTREWPLVQTAVIYSGLSMVLITVQTAMSRLADRASRSTEMVMTVAAAGVALTVMLSGYATGGQTAIPLAAALFAMALLGGRRAAGAIGVAVLMLFCVLVISRLFAGLTTQNGLLLFTAPLLAWIPEAPKLRLAGLWTRNALRLTFTVLPVVAVLWLAQQKFAEDSKPVGGTANEALLNDYMNFGK